jgi:hypothetical protein
VANLFSIGSKAEWHCSVLVAPVRPSLKEPSWWRSASTSRDLPRANERLSAAAQFLYECSYRDDEWRTRRALAELKAQRGDRAGAQAELKSVVEGAQAYGHSFEAQAAREQLRELGVTG